MNMVTEKDNCTEGMTIEKLIEIDPRFEKWTDYVPSLIDKANGGRYIEVYSCPGNRRIFVTGDNNETHAKDRYWALKFYEDNEIKLLGIFDKEEKKEVTNEITRLQMPKMPHAGI